MLQKPYKQGAGRTSHRRGLDMRLVGVFTAVLALGQAPSVRATWSIVMIDTATREVAVGSATCLTSFDLRANLPVVLVDLGAACAQAVVDSGAVNRMRIHDGLLQGLRPGDVLDMLATLDSMHEHRQYGLATVRGRTLTFTGTQANDYAGGVVGQFGSVIYAVQGNVLTGEPVILKAEQALRNTPGDLAEKLMAAMQAARAMGGDGRCSCNPSVPTGCGSPPFIQFDKSAHIGFMIVARTGDSDGACNDSVGCASGNYFLNLNVPNQTGADLDPVIQLQSMFDAWRTGLQGRPDAAQSTAVIDPPRLLADGSGTATMTIALRNWTEEVVVDDGLTVTVTHASDSAATTSIGPVIAEGGGVYRVLMTGSTAVGRDRFLVTVNGGGRPVVLIPRPELLSYARSDLDRDGDVDGDDLDLWDNCLLGPALPSNKSCSSADLNDSGSVDLADFERFTREHTSPACVELFIDEHPRGRIEICGWPFTVNVAVTANPPSRFQWFLNDVAIAGANEASYTVEAAFGADFGDYHVEVANRCRVLVSDKATITPHRVCP